MPSKGRPLRMRVYPILELSLHTLAFAAIEGISCTTVGFLDVLTSHYLAPAAIKGRTCSFRVSSTILSLHWHG